MTDLDRQYAVSIHTLGTSPEPVVQSARTLGARHIILVHTRETAGHLDTIARELGRPAGTIRPIEAPRSDPSVLYERLRAGLDLLALDPHDEIALDITGGTKAMGAGLALFGFYLTERGRTAHLYYVDYREYDHDAGRPVPGTEFLKRLENPLEVFGDAPRARALEAYRRGDFPEAARRYREAADREDQREPPETSLANAQASLDAADFEGAARHLRELLERLERHAQRAHPLRAQAERLSSQTAGLERVASLARAADDKDAPARLERLADPETVAWTLAALDRLAGARIAAGRTAEAALLYYRALELFVQHRLATYGIDSAAARHDFSTLVPNDLDAAWTRANRKTSKDEPLPVPHERKLDLAAGVLLLAAANDPPASDSRLHPGALRNLAKARNSSLLAHGFELPVQDDLAKLGDAVNAARASLPAADLQPVPLE